MSIDSKLVRTTVLLLIVILLVARPALAMPPAPIHFTPGNELARNESYWLAPYTLYTVLEIGSFREARVQWFTPNGKLEHEIRNAHLDNQGFVSRHDSSGTTYTSVANPRWEIIRPARRNAEEGPYGYITWSADGRIFVHSSRTTEWKEDEWPRLPTTIEMFVEGKRKTLGPYLGAPHEIHLDASGALAVHFLDGRLMVVDRSGRERFRETIPVSPRSRLLGCNDHGVLIGDFDETRGIEYYGVEGTRSSFTVRGGYFSLWVGDHRALFHTTLDSLLLVDCAKGQVIWRRHRDGERIVWESQAYAVVGSYLITAAAELGSASSQPRSPEVELRALELQTGKLVASWDCGCGVRDRGAQPRFFERDGKILFLYGSRLSEVDAEDIREGRQGWCSSQPPKPAPPPFEEGPAASPLSWKPIRSRKQAAATPFMPRQRIANVDGRPASLALVHFHDARPYGEKEQRDAWLARYDSVRVQIDSTRIAVLEHLSAAFDATTGNLVCAFTDPAPRWIRSKLKSFDIEARFRESHIRDLAPAAYDTLQSTPGDILGALLRMHYIDLRTAGQIVLRPRFVTARLPARRFEGKLIPTIPPSNRWIVEVLGTKADPEYGFTTYVSEFRDDTREMIVGRPMP